MIDCTNKDSCEVKTSDGKCGAKILGYCPHQNVNSDDAVKINKDMAGDVRELKDA